MPEPTGHRATNSSVCHWLDINVSEQLDVASFQEAGRRRGIKKKIRTVDLYILRHSGLQCIIRNIAQRAIHHCFLHVASTLQDATLRTGKPKDQTGCKVPLTYLYTLVLGVPLMSCVHFHHCSFQTTRLWHLTSPKYLNFRVILKSFSEFISNVQVPVSMPAMFLLSDSSSNPMPYIPCDCPLSLDTNNHKICSLIFTCNQGIQKKFDFSNGKV